MNKIYLYGSSSVFAALKARKRTLSRLLTLDIFERAMMDETSTDGILKMANLLKINRQVVSREKLDQLTQNRPHQGIVLQCGPLLVDEIKGLMDYDNGKYRLKLSEKSYIKQETTREYPFWLALENIIDPQNLGSILRSAQFFGIDGVVLTSRDSAPFSPVTSKASAGALESFENLFLTNSMPKFLSTSAENGWKIYGTDIKNSRELLRKENLDSPTILVMGNEGSGLSQKTADYVMKCVYQR